MSDVFISYAHEDRPAAKTFAELLTRHGHSVFWDRQIAPGTTWDETIERELGQARCVVVLWSRHSVSSKWVKTEAGEAAERSVLLPVLIEQADLPLRFKSIQTATLVDWEGDEEDPELQIVLQSVRKLADRDSPAAIADPSTTAAIRQRQRRRRRMLVWSLIALTLLGGGAFGTYHTAVRKGWFATKLNYFTFLRSGEGLAVGDTVTIQGSPVGEIVGIELMPPGDPFYDVWLTFNIREPYYGWVWSDSRAVVRWTPSRLKRALDIPKATQGVPSYLFHDLVELPLKDALPALERGEVRLAQEVYDGRQGTNLILNAFQKVSAKDAQKLAESGVERLQVFYPRTFRKEPTGLWDFRSGKYEPMIQNQRGYYLPSDEATNPEP